MTQPSMKPADSSPMEYKTGKITKEYRPSVRLKERQETIRQKLTIKDLKPERYYIKDVSDKELRYFLLLSLPIVVTAFVTAMQREDLVNKVVNLVVSFIQGS
jgi:hypothetical protein